MITDSLIAKLRDFIKEQHVPDGKVVPRHGIVHPEAPKGLEKLATAISSFIDKQKDRSTFSILLNNLREERGLSEPELYKKAWVDRKLSSRIMTTRDYHPSKNTALAFGLALELKQDEFNELLESAGYALSRSSIPDLVIMFCVQSKVYDLHDVNALLVVLEQKTLCREPKN